MRLEMRRQCGLVGRAQLAVEGTYQQRIDVLTIQHVLTSLYYGCTHGATYGMAHEYERLTLTSCRLGPSLSLFQCLQTQHEARGSKEPSQV